MDLGFIFEDEKSALITPVVKFHLIRATELYALLTNLSDIEPQVRTRIGVTVMDPAF